MAFEDRIEHPGTNVLEEAKARIRKVLGLYDYVVVSFSGGKDSLVVLELTREVYDEIGWQSKPVNVVFRDEELIPDDVINLVTKYYHDPRFNMAYYAVPMKSHFLFLGEHLPYVQWDVNRKHVRECPPFAIRQVHPDNQPLHQNEMSALTFKDVKGKIGILNGIRARESLLRMQSCLRKRGRENYINNELHKASNFIKPIFDWEEDDVFRYFYDRGIEYCSIYDKEMYCGAPLRVSTPMHDRAFSYLSRLSEMYPVFYAQLCDVFPQVSTHVRYWKDFDRFGIIGRYPKSFEGVVQYCTDHISDPGNLRRALDTLRVVQSAKEANRRNNRYADTPCYGYPLLKVFRTMVAGTYLKGIQPFAEPSPEEIRYEQEAEKFAEMQAAEAIAGEE